MNTPPARPEVAAPLDRAQMRRMTELQTTLILTAVAALLVPLGVRIISLGKRARRAMAPMAGMTLLLGAFFTADPPPPPPAETATPRLDEDDEPKDPKRRGV